MKPTWKKIWKPDGTTVELVDGKPKPEFECIMLPPPLEPNPYDFLKEITEEFIRSRKR